MTFEEIVKQSQQGLKKELLSALHRMGYKTVTKKGFLYAKGSAPVLLVAHLDTVHRRAVKTICYSHDGNMIMSPEGIGGDDRAGVYMILQIIRECRCHVLFCEDEESGGLGAYSFTKSGIKPKVNYIVELDRRGYNDAVFYDCDNPDFTKYVCSFGFVEDFGSFTDISIIAPILGIAAVNISAGYYNEHRQHEHVDMSVVKKNIQRVGKMISTPSDSFQYIKTKPLNRFDLIDNLRPHTEDSNTIRQLKEDAETFGITSDAVDILLDYGYDPGEVEMMLNDPQELQRTVKELFYEMMGV